METLDAWLTVIARDGWGAARLAAVAAAAGSSAAAVAETLPDRWAALRAYGARLDRAALAEAASDPNATVRERLFTMLMERFDAAQAQRLAAQELARAARHDPGLAIFMAVALPQSVARIADAAGVETTGLFGPARVQVLTAIYFRVAQGWLKDESHDLGITMKALDIALAQAERWARHTPHRPGAIAIAAPLSGAGPLPG